MAAKHKPRAEDPRLLLICPAFQHLWLPFLFRGGGWGSGRVAFYHSSWRPDRLGVWFDEVDERESRGP